SQGLVATRRGATGGSFVAHPSAEAIRDNLHTGLGLLATSHAISLADLMEARETWEIPVAEWAALRRDDDDLERLRASIPIPARASDATVFGSHWDFHTCLARASR